MKQAEAFRRALTCLAEVGFESAPEDVETAGRVLLQFMAERAVSFEKAVAIEMLAVWAADLDGHYSSVVEDLDDSQASSIRLEEIPEEAD